MSIGPLQGFGAAVAVRSGDANRRATQIRPSPSPASAGQVPQSDPGSVPKGEVQVLKSDSSQPESPPYEVQMQRDPELQNELIFKYVDRAGNLMFQVPSTQALSVKRGILEEFRQRASDTATPVRQP